MIRRSLHSFLRNRKFESDFNFDYDSVDLLEALKKSYNFDVYEIKGMSHPTWFVYSNSELFAFVLAKDSDGYWLWDGAITPEQGDHVDFYDFFEDEDNTNFPEYSKKTLRILRGDNDFRNTFK